MPKTNKSVLLPFPLTTEQASPLITKVLRRRERERERERLFLSSPFPRKQKIESERDTILCLRRDEEEEVGKKYFLSLLLMVFPRRPSVRLWPICALDPDMVTAAAIIISNRIGVGKQSQTALDTWAYAKRRGEESQVVYCRSKDRDSSSSMQ